MKVELTSNKKGGNIGLKIENVTKTEIYFWNMAGCFLNAISSVLLLVVVNRILDIKNSDIFAITFSIAQLMQTIGMFKVRVYQATDVLEKYSFYDYFVFRVITCLVMIIASFLYAFYNQYDSYKSIILILLCLYKASECVSDVFQGKFQQKERLDLAGKAISIKVVIPSILFIVLLLITHNLFFATLLLTISSIIILLVYDYGIYKKLTNTTISFFSEKVRLENIYHLFLKCLPMFINSFLITSTFNIPKTVIDLFINEGVFETGMQTYYNILFMPAFVMSLITLIFRPQLTSMANYRNNKEYNKLGKTVKHIIIMMCLCFIICLLGGYFLGIPILSILYGTEDMLYRYKSVLLIIIIGGGFNALAYVMDDIITIFRKQKYVMISYVLSWLFCKLSIKYLMMNFGLNGAAVAFAMSMFILMLSNVIILIVCSKMEVTKNA